MSVLKVSEAPPIVRQNRALLSRRPSFDGTCPRLASSPFPPERPEGRMGPDKNRRHPTKNCGTCNGRSYLTNGSTCSGFLPDERDEPAARIRRPPVLGAPEPKGRRLSP